MVAQVDGRLVTEAGVAFEVELNTMLLLSPFIRVGKHAHSYIQVVRTPSPTAIVGLTA
jgi:hypothetical protein